MEVIELKFLLKLLGNEGYKAPIGKLSPNAKTLARDRDNIGRGLKTREIVDFKEEILQFAIAPTGTAVLEIAAEQSLLTAQELKVLRACAQGTATPGKTGVPAEERQAVIQNLRERGFIEAKKTQIKEVWLTERGKEVLAKEYDPVGGGNLFLSKKMLGNYLHFLRKYFSSERAGESSPTNMTEKPRDEEVLQLIIELDKELGTNNYLPIFHLRKKLQPPLSRDELDNALYRLEQQDKIELSSLAEVRNYSEEQLQEGIPQPIGGPLFFIIVY
ncbi:hypothetical protein [Lusitaniella coriacea]|uniref:hypothetical protein n=1 Tax=Lusitaniella coriacea TaxID=1983105 RepID=UPI003CED8218